MSGPATLSVAILNFNHGRFLPDALQAILKQSRAPNELLVIDDASTDDSWRVIEALVDRNASVRAVRNERNRGVIANLNDALERLNGDLVLFAAADDIVLPDLFEDSVALLSRYPEAALCSALSLRMDTDGTHLEPYRSPLPLAEPGFLSAARCAELLVRYDSWFMGNTTIYRRAMLEAIGGYRPELGSFCDGFACRLLALRHGACFVPEARAIWRLSESGYSAATRANHRAAGAIRREALRLMGGEYASDFPPAYAERWARRSQYAILATPGGSCDLGPELPLPGNSLVRSCLNRLRAWRGSGWLRRRFAAVALFLGLRGFDLLPAIGWRLRFFVFHAVRAVRHRASK